MASLTGRDPRSGIFTDALCLAVGDPADPHLAAVTDEVSRRGVTPLVVDAASLETITYRLDDGAFCLGSFADGGTTFRLPLDVPVPGWLRRLAPPRWRAEAPPSSHDAVVRASWLDLLDVTLQASKVHWLTAVDRIVAADNKAVQYAAAARIGVDVPEWCVTNDPEHVWIEPPLVVKPLGPADYVDADGNAKVVYTTAVPWQGASSPRGKSGSANSAAGAVRAHADERWPGWRALPEAPFILQRRLMPSRHLRVVTVGDRVWVATLSRSAPLDWRRDASAHRSFTLLEGDAASDAAAGDSLRVAEVLSLGYSSQDWIVDGESRPWLVDVNPAGQWLFLPEPLASEVTAAIADHLVGGRTAGRQQATGDYK